MKTHGIEVLDPVLETNQLEWMVLPTRECPDQDSERRVIRSCFRLPHEEWGPIGAYVRPVQVRRGRHWVLFRQLSGIGE